MTVYKGMLLITIADSRTFTGCMTPVLKTHSFSHTHPHSCLPGAQTLEGTSWMTRWPCSLGWGGPGWADQGQGWPRPSEGGTGTRHSGWSTSSLPYRPLGLSHIHLYLPDTYLKEDTQVFVGKKHARWLCLNAIMTMCHITVKKSYIYYKLLLEQSFKTKFKFSECQILLI